MAARCAGQMPKNKPTPALKIVVDMPVSVTFVMAHPKHAPVDERHSLILIAAKRCSIVPLNPVEISAHHRSSTHQMTAVKLLSVVH